MAGELAKAVKKLEECIDKVHVDLYGCEGRGIKGLIPQQREDHETLKTFQLTLMETKTQLAFNKWLGVAILLVLMVILGMEEHSLSLLRWIF